MLKVPGGPSIEVPHNRFSISSTDQTVILPPSLLKSMKKLGGLLKGLDEVWALGGGAGELVLGVNVPADRLEIITTEKGCEAIAAKLSDFRALPSGEVDQNQSLAPKMVEKKLERNADIGGMPFPVFVKGFYADFVIEGVVVEVYGDPRIKVGELPWGDRIEYEPTFVNIVGASLPVFPLRIKSELYLGLGWVDRAHKISDAVKRSQAAR